MGCFKISVFTIQTVENLIFDVQAALQAPEQIAVRINEMINIKTRLKTSFMSKGSWLIIGCRVSLLLLDDTAFCFKSCYPSRGLLHQPPCRHARWPFRPEPEIKQTNVVSCDLSPAAGSAWSYWLTRNNGTELRGVKACWLCYWTPTELSAATSLVKKWKARGNRQRPRSLKNIPSRNTYMKKPKKSQKSALLTSWETGCLDIFWRIQPK